MQFRFHTGSLHDSLLTRREVWSMPALRSAIEDWYETKIIGEIEFRYAGFDDRINWDTWNVVGSVYGPEKVVLGQSDSNTF